MIDLSMNTMDLIEVSCWNEHTNHVLIDDSCLNTQELINEVKSRPTLYLKTIHQHISNKEILKSWAEVASNINANRNDCLRVWRKLMKTFRHYHALSSGMLEEWDQYEHLQFLLPFAVTNDLVDYDKHLYIDTIDQHRIDDDKITDPLLMKLVDVMDNEDMFLLSFAPNMTRMNTKQNALARIRILQELYKLEFEDD